MLTPNEIPFFAPPLPVEVDAPPPELFDKEVNELDVGDWLGPLDQYQEFFSALHDTYPVVTAPSSFTYSTDSDHEFAPSQYSSSNGFMSEYSAIDPSSQAMQDLNITLDNANSSDIFFGSPQPAGALPSPPFIDGIPDPAQLFLEVSDFPGDLPYAPNPSASPDLSTNVPIYVTPDALTQTQSAPARANWKSKSKPHKCVYCSHCKADSMSICIRLTPLASLRAQTQPQNSYFQCP